jgi:hypothetical protein
VLVVIGLIIGGILVGRDLIKASEVTAQISQIQKYSSAVNTFRNKYGGLPGDLQVNLANQFGFTAGNGTQGQGNGNGLIEGVSTTYMGIDCCEAAMVWTHLGVAGLIDGEFNTASWTGGPNTALSTVFPLYFPTAKIGNGNYVYVYTYNGANWFGVSGLNDLWPAGNITISFAMTPLAAYNIDKKIDDGMPTTGTVLAVFPAASGLMTQQAAPNQPADNIYSCYNTGGTGGYSISTSASGGNLNNCALSFKFE